MGEEAIEVSSCVGTTRGYQTELLCIVFGDEDGFDAVAYVEPASADLDAGQESSACPFFDC